MRILFMGTPDFAVASLKALVESGYEVAGVFTQADKPKGRGMEMAFSPVKEYALEKGIDVFQPTKMRDGTALEIIRNIAPDLIVVVAYGKILPDDILAAAPLGTINVHGSLLPQYRGAAPIQWSVLNGDRTTGVTTMYLASEMDAGDVIFSDETEIGEFETSGELYERLAPMGAELLIKTVKAIEEGTAPRTPQDHSKATYVTMLDKSLSPIDFRKSARMVCKQICGLQPWPVATAEVNGETLKIFGCGYTDTVTDKLPGEIVSAGKNGIEIACANGETILLTEVQQAGKKRMKAADYLRGHKIEVK